MKSILFICVLMLVSLSVCAKQDGSGGKSNGCDLENEFGCLKLNGGSGWFSFCRAPKAGDADATTTKEADGSDTTCVNIRPFGFQEYEADGTEISSRRVNNFPALTLTNAYGGQLSAACVSGSDFVCGAGVNGSAMNYVRVTASTTIAGAIMNIHFYMLQNNGTVTFGSDTVNVLEGDFKFNIELSGYNFCGQNGATCGQGKSTQVGKSIGFQLTIKSKEKAKLSKDQAEGGLSETSGLINFPQFVARNGTDAKQWNAASTSVTESGSNTVINYQFDGPFTHMVYDPLAPVVSTGSTSTTTSDGMDPAIIGGIVGGVVGVAILAGLVYVVAGKKGGSGSKSDFKEEPLVGRVPSAHPDAELQL